MKEEVVFSEGYKAFFAGAGLKSFSDFLNFTGGEVINKNQRRHVIKFSLDGDGISRVFFLKCFFQPHLKDIFFVWRNLGRPATQARLEWETVRSLNKTGVGSYRIACFGERMKWGIERMSFFVTEKINGEPLTEYVGRNWGGMSEESKRKMMIALGRTVRHIHATKLSLPDLYLWHFFLNSDTDGEYEFSVIDLHRARHNITSRSERIRNLGRLYFSMSEKYFSEEHKELLVESYAKGGYEFIAKKVLDEVRNYAGVIGKRRRLPKY